MSRNFKNESDAVFTVKASAWENVSCIASAREIFVNCDFFGRAATEKDFLLRNRSHKNDLLALTEVCLKPGPFYATFSSSQRSCIEWRKYLAPSRIRMSYWRSALEKSSHLNAARDFPTQGCCRVRKDFLLSLFTLTTSAHAPQENICFRAVFILTERKFFQMRRCSKGPSWNEYP